jgi:DNA-binding CsgD family transcriptional regulator
LDQLADLQKVLGEIGRGLIAVDSHGDVAHATPGAFECLARYVAIPDTDEPILPPALAKWAQEKDGLSEPIILPGDSSRLVVRRVNQSGRVLLLLSEESELPDPAALARYQLTPRETEVLRWLAEGKSNPEIATILGLTAGTVKLHVERILTKLGVENRTAAARIVHGAA